jgi:outer membrane receptor protein involved in Fe transport
MRKRFRQGLAASGLSVVLVLFLAPKASGQAAYGTIIGSATDTSGAGVPNAKVTATDTEKGTSQETSTNDSGNYTLSNLIPGNYKVTIEAKGFKTFAQENLPVIVGSSTTLNATLQVGAVGEVVTVDSAPPLIETDRASVSTDLTSEQVVSLPVFDRNFTALELLLPGSAKMPWQHGQTENPQGGIQINTNGQLFSGTNFMIDGMDNNDPVLGIIIINPPIDSVQGFNATTSNFDAEFSQAGGVVIQVETKSGTNEIHGSGFEFFRNNIFQARDPFNQPTKVPTVHWNQFGGSLGGPIRKDKMFAFFDYQGSRQHNPGSASIRVPTQAERAGDLRDLKINIYDPTTGNPDGTGRTQFVSFPTGPNANSLCTNAAGCPNVIPTSRISTPAANLLATTFVPLPKLTPTDPTVNNYFTSAVQEFNTNQFVARFDHYLTSKLRYFGRYSYGGYYLNSPGALGAIAGGAQLTGFEGTSNVRNQNGVGGLNYSLSPSLLADFRFGVTKYRVFVTAPDESQQLATQVGIPGLNDPARKDTWGLPQLNINGTGGFQMGYQCNCPLNEQELQYQGVTNWTKIISNHTLKGGADIRRRRNLRLPSDQHRSGVYGFNLDITALNAGGTPSGGLGLASFLIGEPSSFSRFAQIDTTEQDVQWSMYYYAEDTWRLTPKLTLNYGLRWDTWFADESLNKGQGGRYDVTTNTVFIPGVGGVSLSGGVQTQYHNFSPRLGVAYSLNPKTVIRAGWGRSYFQGTFGWTFNTLDADVYPSIVNQSIPVANSFSPVNFGAPVAPCASPFCTAPPSATALFPAIPSTGKLPLACCQISTSNIPTNQKIPYVDSYNLTVERVVFTDASLSLAYVGNVGRHLNSGWNLNAPPPGPGTLTSREPLFAAFGLSQDIFNKCDCVSSDYNALQAKFTKRLSRNYSVLASYTWSKTLDFGEFGTPTNQNNYRVDHGPAVFDRASVFTLGHTLLLPFGRGQHYFSDAGSVLNAFVGGWEWTGITTAESGLAFSPGIDAGSLNSRDQGLRPNKVGNPFSGSCPTGGATHTVNCWFNPTAYAAPAAFAFGNASHNSLRGPGLFTADWGLDKNFQLTEKVKMQLRWEVFNALNVANWANPGGDVTKCNASVACTSLPGQITDVSLPMRNQQIGLRFTW